jgi:pilus assembly protein CpaF
MVLMAGLDLPVRAIREQISSAIDLIVHQERLRDGTRRVTHVTEVLGMEGEVVTTQDLFVFDQRAGHDEQGRHLGALRWTGLRPRLLDLLADAGITVPPGVFTGAQW